VNPRTNPDLGFLTAILLAILVTGALAPAAMAQRFGPGRARGAGHAGFVLFGHARRAQSSWLIGPYLYSDYDYDGQPEATEEPLPQIIVVPVTQSAGTPRPTGSAESLVLELQGDRWVRVTNHGDTVTDEEPSGAREPGDSLPSSVISTQRASIRQAAEANITPGKLPPAVLVFRDGHREEIEKYTIVGTTIHMITDYWRTGAWSRSVNLADLDVPATLRANQEAGANFRLPSGPSEVVVRP
jgi:hypothetical protein